MTIVTWTGDPAGVLDHLPDSFRPLALAPDLADARLLINFAPDAQTAIDAATQFAAADAQGQDRLIVTVLQKDPDADWPRAREAAVLWAFTRHAALKWARDRIRVNAIGLGVSPDLPFQAREAAARAADAAPAASAVGADIAACILAMWRWRSMTGQIVRLGAR